MSCSISSTASECVLTMMATITATTKTMFEGLEWYSGSGCARQWGSPAVPPSPAGTETRTHRSSRQHSHLGNKSIIFSTCLWDRDKGTSTIPAKYTSADDTHKVLCSSCQVWAGQADALLHVQQDRKCSVTQISRHRPVRVNIFVFGQRLHPPSPV